MMNEILETLVSGLKRRIETFGHAVLVIDGDCAAGKTTLAARIAARFSCNLFHMDDFFLPPALRTEERLSEPGGNVDYERFFTQVLVPLKGNEAFTYGAYSCADGSTATAAVAPRPCAVVEGSYALHPRFLDAYREMGAMLLFLRVPEDEQLRRIQKRNGEAMLRRFRDEWIPLEKRYQQAFLPLWGDVTVTDG
jgi:uridine kinase